MREIKFRAWDAEKEQMIEDPYHFEEYHYSDDNRVNQCVHRYYEDWSDLEDGNFWECIIMQYTGLKDKNGKKIYEGDIIQTAQGHPRVIVWDGGAFHSRVHNWKPRQDMPSHPIHFWSINNDLLPEIIGNIYQNPELLNDEKIPVEKNGG